MHEKSLHRQIGVGTLACTQEQRALLVPLINRLSAAGFVPPSVYIRFPLFVIPKRRPQQLSLIRQSVRGRVSWANGPVGGPFCPALRYPPPRRARNPRFLWLCIEAILRHDPPMVCPDFGFDRYIVFRLCVLWTVVLDASEGTRDNCSLGELFFRPPVLPGSAPPRCPAVGRPDLTRPW